MNTSTPWFGISLGLMGLIVGSLVATALSPVTSAQVPPSAPAAPVAPTPVPAGAGCGWSIGHWFFTVHKNHR